MRPSGWRIRHLLFALLLTAGSGILAWTQFFDVRSLSTGAVHYGELSCCGSGWPITFVASIGTTLPRTQFTRWSASAFLVDLLIWAALTGFLAVGLAQWLPKRPRFDPCFWLCAGFAVTLLLAVSEVASLALRFGYWFNGIWSFYYPGLLDAVLTDIFKFANKYGLGQAMWVERLISISLCVIFAVYVAAAGYGFAFVLLESMRRWMAIGPALLLTIVAAALSWFQFFSYTSLRGAENRWGSGWLWTAGRPWQYLRRLENRWPPRDWNLDDFHPWALAADIAVWLLAVVFSWVAIRRLNVKVQRRLNTMLFGVFVIAIFLAMPNYYQPRQYEVRSCLFFPAVLGVGLGVLGFCFWVLDWIVWAEEAIVRRRAERKRRLISPEEPRAEPRMNGS